MTELSALSVAKLSAGIVGGDVKRSATKAEAIARFTKLAAEKGIDATAILSAEDPNAALLAALAPKPNRIGGAGLARLRANADAEALRLSTVAESDKARADVVAKMPKPRNAEAVKAKAEKPAARDRAAPAKASDVPAPKTRSATVGKIVSVVENPKKSGSRSHARFALYRAGMTTEDFVAACVAAGFPEKEARADLSWDRRKNFIKIEP